MRVFPGISCITLGVADLERATIFYEMLGWKVAQHASGADASFFQMNNIVLALRPAQLMPAHLMPAHLMDQTAGGGRAPGVMLSQHYGSHRAVAKVLYIAARAKAPGLFGPTRLDAGGSAGGFTDLDGHAWQIAHDPTRPPSPDGSLILPE